MGDGRISNTSMNQTLNAVLTKAWPHDGECETVRERELGNGFSAKDVSMGLSWHLQVKLIRLRASQLAFRN
jgi:hypothetical protein